MDKKPSEDECGGLYCETMPFTCSNEYTIAFSCTNTTYKDSNGNAEGITIFVTTDCNTNERLGPNQQDPRYVNQLEDPFGVYESLKSDLTPSYDEIGNDFDKTQNGYLTRDPDVFPSCARGCLCSYAPKSPSVYSIAVYTYCDCSQTIPDIFLVLVSYDNGRGTEYSNIYTTPTNLSLLDSYYVSYDFFNTTITGAGGTWINIPEGSNLTLQTGFECFGDAETISDVIPVGDTPFDLR